MRPPCQVPHIMTQTHRWRAGASKKWKRYYLFLLRLPRRSAGRSPERSLGKRRGERRRGHVPQARMRSPVVVLQPPLHAQHPGLRQRSEQLRIQQLIPQPPVEALGVAVLPRAARLDIQRLDPRRLQPKADPPGNKLRAVIAADVQRRPADKQQFPEHVDHLDALERPPRLQRQALPSVLIHHAQPLQRPPVLAPVVDEVPRPDLVLLRRGVTHDAVGAAAQATLLMLLLRHFQALSLPQPMHTLAVHFETFSSQQTPDPAISVTRMLTHQLQHPGHQGLFILTRPRSVPLR